jgi:hypothetical protein
MLPSKQQTNCKRNFIGNFCSSQKLVVQLSVAVESLLGSFWQQSKACFGDFCCNHKKLLCNFFNVFSSAFQ